LRKYLHNLCSFVIFALTLQMVKLMKVEAGSKLKLVEQQRVERKELLQLRETNVKQAQMITMQKR
jgi:hypothetical protein